MIRLGMIAAVLCIAAAPAARAHVVLAEPKAEPGAYYAGFFRVGHGCEGSRTVSLRVDIPVNVSMAKPQPKPGWTVSIERVPLDKPAMDHGKPVYDRVSAVIWKGRLADHEFDQFGILMKLPQDTGLLYFPTVQTCEKGELRWTEIPVEGQDWHDVPRPAPVLRIEGAGGGHLH